MENRLLIVSSSPHLRAPENTARLMAEVQIALIPAFVASIIFFGFKAVGVVLAAVAGAVLTEWVWQVLMKKPVTISDGSAVLTGILLAFILPPSVPLWIPFVGSVFAIALVKQFFGGLGANFLNPALAGRAFLLASWPALVTAWVAPFDGVSTATPLVSLVPKAGEVAAAVPGKVELFIGNVAGSLGETSALALLAGGLYLLWRGVIDWRIPAGFIGTVAALTWVFGGTNGPFTGDPVAHILAGGVLLGAFFMATDYVTSPVTKKGRLIMGIGCGLITVLIRLYGGYPEGVCYSILLMNIATPLIDRFTMPRKFGEVRAR